MRLTRVLRYGSAWVPRLKAALTVSALVLIAGCSSSDKRLGWINEASDNSKADGAAYAADGFTFRKEQPIRGPNDFQFYFKHCAQAEPRNFYSKTSYWCTEP